MEEKKEGKFYPLKVKDILTNETDNTVVSKQSLEYLDIWVSLDAISFFADGKIFLNNGVKLICDKEEYRRVLNDLCNAIQ